MTILSMFINVLGAFEKFYIFLIKEQMIHTYINIYIYRNINI